MNTSRILIVEDNEAQRKVLCESLTQKGFLVLEAKNGQDGLKMSLKEHPDVILMDIRMPKMNGMEMIHELRKDNWGKRVSVIILTNYDANDAQIFQISVELPAYYLLKANNPLGSIFEKIKEVLEAKK